MHPAHDAFRQWLRDKRSARIGQVLIRTGDEFELRHVEDASEPADRLTTSRDPYAARSVALFTESGKYRPLKSAPSLRRGWRIEGLDFAGLIAALDLLYPAAIAHWHAWGNGTAEVTSYRSCAGRQTGMYRITTKLDDAQVCRVAECCCNDGECLKIPFWSVDGKKRLTVPKSDHPEPDRVPIPCPEPCSLLLSFARKAVRMEQEDLLNVEMTKSDLELIGAVLRGVLEGEQSSFREGDFNDPRHRQRIAYFLKRYEHLFPRPGPITGTEPEE